MKLLMSKRRIMLNNLHAETRTATGDVVTFNTDVIAPFKNLIANFSPVQDLHGQSNPYPAGGGKNLFGNLVEGYFEATGAIHAQSASLEYYTVDYYSVGSNTTGVYQIWKTGANTDSWCGVACYDGDKTFISRVHATRSFDASGYAWNTVTFAEGTKYIRISMRTLGSDKLMFELGSTATDYAPYSNICPISGWTGCNVYQSGADYATEAENGTINTDGSDSSDTGKRTPYIKVKTGDIVEATIKNDAAGYRYARIACYDASKQFISLLYNAVTAANAEKTITETVPNDTAFIRLGVYQGTINSCIVMSDYPVSWETDAGTVYGGYIDVVKGTLTATHGYVDLGTLPWEKNASFFLARSGINSSNTMNNSNANLWCSQYKPSSKPYWTQITVGNDDMCVGAYGVQVKVVDSYYLANSSKDAFKTAMSGVYLAYELATPITYNLTPETIRSLRGTNNVWTDTNEDTSVTYVHGVTQSVYWTN